MKNNLDVAGVMKVAFMSERLIYFCDYAEKLIVRFIVFFTSTLINTHAHAHTHTHPHTHTHRLTQSPIHGFQKEKK